MFESIKIVAAGIFGLLMGRIIVPQIANILLCRAYCRFQFEKQDLSQTYCLCQKTALCKYFSSMISDKENILTSWLRNTCVVACGSCLRKTWTQDFESKDSLIDEKNVSFNKVWEKKQFAFSAKYRQSDVCAIVGIAGTVLLAFLHVSFMTSITATICFFTMLIAVVCDLRARIIPYECCVVVALFGAFFQMSTAGFSGLFAGTVCGIAVVAVCATVNHFGRRHEKYPIGYGDIKCMGALSIATGFNTWSGLFFLLRMCCGFCVDENSGAQIDALRRYSHGSVFNDMACVRN